MRIHELEQAEDARALADEAAEIGGSDLVWVCGHEWRPEEPTRDQARRRRVDVREHAIACDRATPTVWIDAGRGPEARPVPTGGWEGWTWAVRELLRSLV